MPEVTNALSASSVSRFAEALHSPPAVREVIRLEVVLIVVPNSSSGNKEPNFKSPMTFDAAPPADAASYEAGPSPKSLRVAIVTVICSSRYDRLSAAL